MLSLMLAASLVFGAPEALSSGVGLGFVDAADFGAVPDGITDSTQAFLEIGAYMRAHPGTTCHFRRGTGAYLYSKNWWLIGVTNGVILGEPGTRFKNNRPETGGPDIYYVGLVTNYDHWKDVNPTLPDPWSAAALTDQSFLIRSANSRDTQVLTASRADAGNFAAGDWVLVHGYNIYPGGWPPSPGYRDYAKVVSSDARTGLVVVDRPLKNNYDARWYDAVSGDARAPVGRPRILKLTRGVYKVAEYLRIENIELLPGNRNPHGWRYGTLHAVGCIRLELVNCSLGGVDPSECERVIFRNCRIHGVEIDKVLSRVDFENSMVEGAYGGSGADRVVFRGCEIAGTLQIWSDSLLIEDCDVYANSGDNAMIRPWGRDTVLRDVRFRSATDDPATLLPIHPGPMPLSLTAVAAGTDWITAAVDSQQAPFAGLRPGDLLWKSDSGGGWGVDIGDSGVVKSVYYDGINAKIEIDGRFRTAVAPGTRFYWRPVRTLAVRDCVVVDRHSRQQPIMYAWEFRPEVYANDLESDRAVHRTSVSLRGLKTVYGSGFLTRVLVVVEKASVGATKLSVGGQTIDTTQVGIREITPFGGSGAKGSDTLSPLTFAGSIGVTASWTSGTPITLPEGVIILEFTRRL